MQTIIFAADALPLLATEAVRAVLARRFASPVYFDPEQNAPGEPAGDDDDDDALWCPSQEETFRFRVHAPLPPAHQAWTAEQVVAYYAGQWVAQYAAQLLREQPAGRPLRLVELAALGIRGLRLTVEA